MGLTGVRAVIGRRKCWASRTRCSLDKDSRRAGTPSAGVQGASEEGSARAALASDIVLNKNCRESSARPFQAFARARSSVNSSRSKSRSVITLSSCLLEDARFSLGKSSREAAPRCERHLFHVRWNGNNSGGGREGGGGRTFRLVPSAWRAAILLCLDT